MTCYADPARPLVQKKGAPAVLASHSRAAPPMRATAPLPESLRRNGEALGGFSLADVRIHRESPEPARLGALAFTRGSDIHLGPDQERHLPHEAWHVVQQKQGRVAATARQSGVAVNDSLDLEAEADSAAERLAQPQPARNAVAPGQATRADVVQKKDPKDKPPPPTKEESETALGNILRGADFADGYALAFYDEGEPEAQRRAADFATRENALGFAGKKPTAAGARVGSAIAGVFGIQTTALALAAIADAALARVPAAAGVPPVAAAAPGKIKTIAIFAHGTPTWCSAGVTTGNAAGIFSAIAPKMAANVTVILYTCNSARGTDEDEEWVKGTMDGGGKGSLAELVRDTLVDKKIDKGTVWGHTTTGHTSRNSALRVFETSAGKGTPGESYVAKHVFTDVERAAAIADLAARIAEMGYAVTATDAKFVAAATAILRGNFYAAWTEASGKAGTDNLAESAPVDPSGTAAKATKYWTDVYWPRERQKAADKVIARMKLKKPKAK